MLNYVCVCLCVCVCVCVLKIFFIIQFNLSIKLINFCRQLRFISKTYQISYSEMII